MPSKHGRARQEPSVPRVFHRPLPHRSVPHLALVFVTEQARGHATHHGDLDRLVLSDQVQIELLG